MDVLPEYFPYRDVGCDVSASCLSCPLPKCKYDDPGWLHRQRRALRDWQVLEAKRQEGVTITELAQRFSISQRTVHRILARADGNGFPPQWFDKLTTNGGKLDMS